MGYVLVEDWPESDCPYGLGKRKMDSDQLTDAKSPLAERFPIGCEFECGGTGKRWRCTDIGTRVIVAIQVDNEAEEDLCGPPYGVAETTFDEDDQQVCVRIIPDGPREESE